MVAQTLKIAVVGDVHDHWDDNDAVALRLLGVDLVLFVGDFGNESVEVVRQIARLELPKAVVFGNHDAWYTATSWGREKCPYDRTQEDRVQQQIDVLEDAAVGFGKKDFPQFGVSVVGGRPFSWGGPEWKTKRFYRDRFGVRSFAESADRMIQAVQETAFETVIFIGHNGPTGLGAEPEDPCGKDWQPLGGDFGDPDFGDAIAKAYRLNKRIPLVGFGHMHHTLRHTKARLRRRTHFSAEGTLYLNAACVPRIIQTEQGRWRNFSIVTLRASRVCQASLVWVSELGELRSSVLHGA
jgi:uncharacterized protein (TIGR04168 family)